MKSGYLGDCPSSWCDVGDAGTWKETLKNVNNSLDGVDVLINNASALYINKESSVKEMDVLYRVNTRATMLAIQRMSAVYEPKWRIDRNTVTVHTHGTSGMVIHAPIVYRFKIFYDNGYSGGCVRQCSCKLPLA